MLVAGFVVLSIGLALSEGISVSLLIPALDSNAMTGVLSTVPVLRALAAWLAPDSGGPRACSRSRACLPSRSFCAAACSSVSQFLSALIPLRLQCAIMTRCYDALVDADLAYMPERKFGELQAVLRDHPQRAAAVLNGLLTILVSIILVAIFGLLMLLVSWQMTLAAVVFIASRI